MREITAVTHVQVCTQRHTQPYTRHRERTGVLVGEDPSRTDFAPGSFLRSEESEAL